MKRYLICLMAVCLVMTVLPFGAWGTETEYTEPPIVREPGMCGEDLRWSYADGTLTISGSGDMDGFEEGLAPWQEHKDTIKTVILSGNITSVGACAFTDFDALETVEFGNALHTIGYRAFKSCDSLMRIVLPATFRKFDEECFMSCQRLGEIWCRGGMPSFKTNCIWDITATIFYPPAKAWPAEYVIPLGDAFRWQIQFQAMDVPEEYLNTTPAPQTLAPEQTEPVQTEPIETEPLQTEPPVTQPAETVPAANIVPETVPVTEATQSAETEPVASVETKPAWLEEMEALEKEQKKAEEETEKKPAIGIGLIVGLCILSGIFALILIGALVFRRRSY